MRKVFPFLVFLSISLGLFSPLFQRGVPQTQDGENHLARFAAYAMAFHQGQIPPRWAPLLNGGFGYPVLNYGYPLANMLALPFVLVKIPVEFVYKVLAAGGLLLGACGTWKVLRDMVISRGQAGAWFGAAVFLLHSYGWTNLYVRGSIGELLGWSVLPVLFWAGWKLLSKPSRSTALLFYISFVWWGLAHNVVTLLSLPLVVAGFIWLAKKNGLHAFIRRMAPPLFLAVFSVSFFWIPAWFEKNMAVVTETAISKETELHVLSWQQLLFAPLSVGFSEHGPVDGMGLGIGVLSVVVIAFAFMSMFAQPTKQKAVMLGAWFLFAVVCTQQSAIFWHNFPGGQFVQFPWRILGILQVLTAIIGGFLYGQSGRIARALLLFALCISLINVIRATTAPFASKSSEYYQTFPQTTTVMNEYRAKTFTFQSGDLSPQKPSFSTNDVEYQVLSWNGSVHKYTLKSQAAITVTEPTMYFPGWKTTANGASIHIDPVLHQGLIAFQLPAGSYVLETRFTQETPARVVGNILSIIGITGMAVYWKKYRTFYAAS